MQHDAPEGDLLQLEDDDNNVDSLKLTKVPTVSFPRPTSPIKRPPPIPLKSTDSISSPDGGEPASPLRPKEWTKFPESPTSNMSSPGPKPVNFYIQRTTQAVSSDPQILHPVALRVTPEVVEEEPSRRKTTESGLVYEAGVIIREVANSSPKVVTTQRDSVISIQRPQPKKMSSKGSIPPPPPPSSSSTNSTTIAVTAVPAQVSTVSTSVNNTNFAGLPSKKEPPPLPPPRGSRGHTRSSSLDLKS